MASPYASVKFGTSGVTSIAGPCDPGNAWNLVWATLLANYTQSEPDGPLPGHFPTRPRPGGVQPPGLPLLILSGDRRQYWNAEAQALISAGVAVAS